MLPKSFSVLDFRAWALFGNSFVEDTTCDIGHLRLNDNELSIVVVAWMNSTTIVLPTAGIYLMGSFVFNHQGRCMIEHQSVLFTLLRREGTQFIIPYGPIRMVSFWMKYKSI